MSWFKRKQEYYDAGYKQSTNVDLSDTWHTPESHAEHAEQEGMEVILDPRYCDDEREFMWGIIDGAKERAKKK